MFWLRNKKNIFLVHYALLTKGLIVQNLRLNASEKVNVTDSGTFACFLLSADIFQNELFKKYFRNTSLADLGPNCLQKLSTDNTITGFAQA